MSVRVGRIGSVRSRLTLLATALVAVALVGASLGLLASQRRSLTASVDLSLAQRADNLAPTIRRDPAGTPLPEAGDPEDQFIQILDRDGSVLNATANAANLDGVVAPRNVGSGERITTLGDLELSASRFRVLARPLLTAAGPLTLVVGQNLDDVAESIAGLRSALLVGVPIVVLLLAALMWWLTGRVLQPVESIRREVATLGATQLHRRVPVPPRDDELARLARTMNEMLDRVEYANQQQQRFVADASHELRSPMTRLRTQIELAISHPEVDRASTHEHLLAEVIDLSRLLDDLLLTVRLDSDPVMRHAAVDLDDIVLDEARRLRGRGRVVVETNEVGAARVSGDADQLARAIRNLADNAERHAAGMVRFSLREQSGTSVLAVADDGPGIPPQHHAEIFERFARLDEARSRDQGGTGLVLAIVRDIIERHGGTITLDSAPGLGTRFVIELPRLE